MVESQTCRLSVSFNWRTTWKLEGRPTEPTTHGEPSPAVPQRHQRPHRRSVRLRPSARLTNRQIRVLLLQSVEQASTARDEVSLVGRGSFRRYLLMPKRRQHYVPKLYLRAFQSSPLRINLYHLASRQSFKDASLRDQCYSRNFYGPSPEIEDRLGELEDLAAPVLQAICKSGEPPVLGTEQHRVLLAFIGLQILRTPVARKNIKDSWVKLDNQIFGDSGPSPESNLQRFSPEDDHQALAFQIKLAPQYADALADLRMLVVRTGHREKLIASDNPVF